MLNRGQARRASVNKSVTQIPADSVAGWHVQSRCIRSLFISNTAGKHLKRCANHKIPRSPTSDALIAARYPCLTAIYHLGSIAPPWSPDVNTELHTLNFAAEFGDVWIFKLNCIHWILHWKVKFRGKQFWYVISMHEYSVLKIQWLFIFKIPWERYTSISTLYQIKPQIKSLNYNGHGSMH